MASFIFDSFADDLVKGNIVPNADAFKVMLVSAAPTTKKTALKRSDIGSEVTGTGYTAGGTASTCTVAKDTVNDKETLTFANPSWAASTITAVGAVIYKSRGGASSADEIVAYVDFGGSVSSTAATFAVTFSSPLTIQN